MGKRFLTINTTDWENSIYVPQTNGKITVEKNVHNQETSCWYIDSNNGRWTTLMAQFEQVNQGDEIELVFWTKYSKTPQVFRVEIMHRDYEKRVTYELSPSSSYFVGKMNGCELYKITHIVQESDFMSIGISVFGCEMTIFAAAEQDIVDLLNVPKEKGMISKIHPVVTLMKGENYGFCGCMAYLSDCLGLNHDIFDFHYYAMATGDIFTQVHRDSLCDCTDCVSDYLFDNDIIYKAFSANGYAYEYIDETMIHGNEATLLERIKTSIDNDIPVISAGFEGELGYDFCMICGYTEDGKLKIMFKENKEPMLQDNIFAFTKGLIFTGDCHHEINLKQQFSTITRTIYNCINRKAERGCTFGKEAFQAWADSLVNSGIANAKSVDSWCSFAYNLCIAGTNGYAGTPMLKDILKKCPEFQQTKAYSVLIKVCEQFDIQNKIFMELMQMGYGFDLTENQLRDVVSMRPAAKKILEFCEVCDRITNIYTKQLLEEDDFWNVNDYRIVKCYKEAFPYCRFVGKCYKNKDRVDGMFGFYWGEFFEKDFPVVLERLLTDEFRTQYPEAGAYVGLMKNKDGAPDDYFEYWIGMFLPENCEVPEGFGFIDLKHDAAGVCWIKGKEENVYCHEGECYQKLVESGMSVPSEPDGGCYMFERYACPRFTTPDEYNEVILDLGFFVEKDKR